MLIKAFKLLTALVLAGILLSPFLMLFCLMAKTPLVSEHEKFSVDNVQRVKDIVYRNKPRDMNKKQVRTIRLTETDLNTLMNYGFVHGLGTERIFTRVELPENRIRIRITVQLPSNPLGRFLNAEINLESSGLALYVAEVKTEKINLPGLLINPVLKTAHALLLSLELYRDIYHQYTQALKDIAIGEGYLKLVYEWDPAALDQIHEKGKDLLIPKSHQEKLVLYHNQLARTVAPYKDKAVSLAAILAPMFQYSTTQSAISHNPGLENTILLQVLSLYSIQRGIKDLVHEDLLKQVDPISRTSFTLYGRTDLPKHFLISAGVAVSAGTNLSNFIGIAKEVADSDRGSGFSFADLAADKAGVRLGELAASKDAAARLQQSMEAVSDETAFMPLIGDLPEGIRKLEFKKRYTDLDSESYALVNGEIEKRIRDCPVYRTAGSD